MKLVGHIESLWRYPVKSMRGHEVEEAFLGFEGVYGDRIFSFLSSAAPKNFPYFTGREQPSMLMFRPRFRDPERATKPHSLQETQSLSSSAATPPGRADTDLLLDVETPAGEIFAIDDSALLARLQEGLHKKHELCLLRSERALTDCSPISMLSLQTVHQLGSELGMNIDKRRFRANLYINLNTEEGFSENGLVGCTLRIGEKATIAITDCDPRCKMITLDPDDGKASPAIMRQVAKFHDGTVGVYGIVVTEGIVRAGDEVSAIDATPAS